MAHFSKFIRPGAVKIGCTIEDKEVLSTAIKNPDSTIAVVVFNPTEQIRTIEINLKNSKTNISINAKALQTIVIKP